MIYLDFRTYYQIPRERNEPLFQLNSFLKDFTLIIIYSSNFINKKSNKAACNKNKLILNYRLIKIDYQFIIPI